MSLEESNHEMVEETLFYFSWHEAIDSTEICFLSLRSQAASVRLERGLEEYGVVV